MQRHGLPVARTMIIAPHPDDDVLAAGGLIQHALSAGGTLRILYVTDGENNPWPQRAVERRLIIRDRDRLRWGSVRRSEALDSLRILGAPADTSRFLGFPDHRIASLLMSGVMDLEGALTREMDDFDPTLVISPSHYDLHPDHRAIAAFVDRALKNRSMQPEVRTYVLHGSSLASRVETVLHLSASERARKEQAILRHRSQLYLSRSRFLAHAGEFETFCREELDLPERGTRVRFFLASLGHIVSVFAGRTVKPVVPPQQAPTGDAAAYDPAARHA
jgi:LmbE family N-acetylglucosaminyl deacetylase